MYEFQPYERAAWAILVCLAVANIVLMLFNIWAKPKHKLILIIRQVLDSQMGLLFVIALLLEMVPLLCIYDMTLYGSIEAKRLFYFRVFRAIYVGTLVNLVLLFVNRCIANLRTLLVRLESR